MDLIALYNTYRIFRGVKLVSGVKNPLNVTKYVEHFQTPKVHESKSSLFGARKVDQIKYLRLCRDSNGRTDYYSITHKNVRTLGFNKYTYSVSMDINSSFTEQDAKVNKFNETNLGEINILHCNNTWDTDLDHLIESNKQLARRDIIRGFLIAVLCISFLVWANLDEEESKANEVTKNDEE